MKLSKESIEYCKTIRGKNYKGCGNDYDFCNMCRNHIRTKEDINSNTKKINDYVRKRKP